MDPTEKDALLHAPGLGLTFYEEAGMAKKTDRYRRFGSSMAGDPMGGNPEYMNQFTRLDLYSRIFKPPAVKFKDMKAVVSSRLTVQLLPFEVRTDFLRITEESVLTPITIQVANRDLQFENKQGVMHAALDIFGQITTLGGRIASTFEDSVLLDVPENDFQRYMDHKSVYQKALPLRPGRYKLSVVVKDDLSGRMGSMDIGIQVPRFGEEQLANSSLILADLIQPLPTAQVGSGPFVIGGTKVRPSVSQQFTRDQNLGIYMQVYNLGLDPQTHRPSADIHYEIAKDGKALLDQTEEAAKMGNASQQITVQKTLPLRLLEPGKYTVQIKVTDNIRKQAVAPTATFEVR
jgi:hypothetical protein